LHKAASIAPAGFRGDDDHRHVVAALAHPAQHLDAVAARKAEIQQHRGVGLRRDRRLDGAAVAHPVYGVALLREPVAHARARLETPQQQSRHALAACRRLDHAA
jgi:hypothetical protein